MSLFKKIMTMGFLFIVFAYPAAEGSETRISPKMTPKGDKWRIGYYEGGTFIDYQKTFLSTINGLMELGWIEKTAIPTSVKTGEQTREIWNWLTNEAKSDYLEFVADAHYSPKWEKTERKKTSKHIIHRLNTKKDIDLIIAMGTWAGQDLANNNHRTPTVIMSTSDPLKSGIIKSIKDSGYNHVHARIDPYRYENQIRLFYKTIKFKKLGIIYEDTIVGRSYAAVDKVEKVAEKSGFEIVRCFAESDIADVDAREMAYLKCFRELSEKTDAIYVSAHGGLSNTTIPELVQIAISKRIPTFSQGGSHEVKNGFLLSLSNKSFRGVGLFEAAIIAKIFNGAKPRDLPQVFEGTRTLAINLKTAESIGFTLNLPLDVLAAADEIFHDISRP